MIPVLSEIEARVLGCLMEKEMSTPDYYPLTLNSLVLACNQKSNRCPEMSLDEAAVREAVDTLRYRHHLVWEVSTAGSRVPKYKHDAEKSLGLTAQDKAVLCELLVRGPQTAGEVRSHAGRLCDFKDPDEAAAVLRALEQHAAGPYVVQLPREAGARERRYAHLLSGPPAPAPAPAADRRPADREPGLRERVAAIESDVASMKSDIQALRDQVLLFMKKFE